MEQKELKIIPPEGYEIDEEKSTFKCIIFKKKNSLPKTWKEFCDTHPKHSNEAYISTSSNINPSTNEPRLPFGDRNVLPSTKDAKAMLALCQLIQLRDCYNDGWVPDWNDDASYKYEICVEKGTYVITCNVCISRVLHFKTRNLAKQFLENFEDLINIAKPLL